MLSIVENIQTALTPFYSFGVNMINHIQNIFSYLGDSYNLLYSAIQNYVPAPFVVLITCFVSISISKKIIHWE